ncbi:80516420-5957-43be-ab05-25ef7b9f1f96 [Sclerotinia trifoliorum]|uniref:80516420-5957-43be-ab05-25ef7b9f1f96 n=1 Tax=Sclerotinia trifoliorum TaxID=28548 RepID=A0A8H2VYT0_9HELO|nr:80516420-5957-43be-ab05-25ef7b9f1f96 [Sclerotinia trifoliorum]
MRPYFSRSRKDNLKRQKKRELTCTAIERERESTVPLLNMNPSSLRQGNEGHDETKNIEVEGCVSPTGNSNDGRISPASKLSSDTGALTSDSVSDGLSIQDKKILLVAAEIDEMGMGRYQWYIWGLCGLGYFLDLLWAHAFGLIAPVMQREMGIDDTQLGRLFTVVNAGLTVGALVWGVLVDIIGRKWAFNGTVFITSVFGICMAIPSSYTGLLVLVAFTGFGIGGNIPIDTTIALEFLPQKNRFLLALLSIFQPIGVVVCSGIAYGFIPKHSCATDLPSCKAKDLTPGAECCSKRNNMGWRYLLYTLGAISLFIFILRFLVFTFQESPKYLLSKGRDEEALKVLQKIAKTNKKPLRLTIEDFRSLDNTEALLSPTSTTSGGDRLRGRVIPEGLSLRQKIKREIKRVGILFKTKHTARVTILVWLIYAFDYWGFSVAGAFLPTILARKGLDHKVGYAETYRNFVIIYMPGIVGVSLGALMVKVPRVGRRLSMIFSSALMATSFFLFAAVNTQAANVGLSVMEYFFQSMFNSVLYGWTPEAFPASVRGTASGMASCWGRLFSIFSPIIAAKLLAMNLNGPLFLAGAGTLVACLGVALLPDNVMKGNEI